jgi:hypothetical protein
LKVLLRASVVFALLAVTFAAATSAQQKEPPVLRGRVLAGGQPVANQSVALHRVTQAGEGFTLDQAVTDSLGRFELRLDSVGAGDGVMFAASRYQGELYIGQTFRQLPASEYELLVGPGATPIDLNAAATEESSTPSPDHPRAGLTVILVGIILLSTIFGLALRNRIPPERRLLVEIAQLDNRNAATPLPRYEEQRAELVRRLRESA